LARDPSDDEDHAVETPNFYPPISEPNVRYQQQVVFDRMGGIRTFAAVANAQWTN